LYPSHLSDYFPIRKYRLLYVIIGVIIPGPVKQDKYVNEIVPAKNRRNNFYRTKGEIFMITKIDTPISLGLAVRTARKRLALTQPQLALASGVGVRFMVELEAGKPTLRLENVLRVLHALGGSLCVEGLEKGQED
jgi:y4mF family transcriptional regulator